MSEYLEVSITVRPGRPELNACGERVPRLAGAFGEAGIPVTGNAKSRILSKKRNDESRALQQPSLVIPGLSRNPKKQREN
ncbi:MAG: hypothetical protein LBK56_03660 [Gracilibacteraceae bacterium]|jgi:hypothetical protein|nr:hypothetical protein [Gracilibacteraceae bacterium]